jgi:YbgC/YbaW family acyl-CoA thioester hydrolase
MARIKIDLPEHFSFTTVIPIRITDLNYGGHVGNDTVLSIIHEARVQFMQHHGYKELDMAGVALIMSDAAIEFKREIFYRDILKVSVAVSEFSRVGFDIFYKLEKQTDSKNINVAVAKTGMVCYNYELKKIAQMPVGVKEKLTG